MDWTPDNQREELLSTMNYSQNTHETIITDTGEGRNNIEVGTSVQRYGRRRASTPDVMNIGYVRNLQRRHKRQDSKKDSRTDKSKSDSQTIKLHQNLSCNASPGENLTYADTKSCRQADICRNNGIQRSIFQPSTYIQTGTHRKTKLSFISFWHSG